MHTDDILEQLLDYAELAEIQERPDMAELMRSAALEIERLRLEIQGQEFTLPRQASSVVALPAVGQ